MPVTRGVWKVDRFWFCYFIVRMIYLVFTIFVYSRLTSLGDTERYLTSAQGFSLNIFISSTALMDFLGGSILGRLGGGHNILTNLPAALISFYMVKWAIEKLQFRKYINKYLLFILISLPNFCIWTSVFSKETVGLIFSSILGVLIVNYLKGDYKIRFRDWFAFYLCLLFKPQYLPFILQGLFYIKLAQKYCKTAASQLVLGLVMLLVNVGILFSVRELVNEYARIMPIHFLSEEAGSNRNEDIWEQEDAVFTKAPVGMLVAFVGPSLSEITSKPTFLIAGLESAFILALFFFLMSKFLYRFLVLGRLSVRFFFSYFIIFTGIAFMHYPFGIFNPGSAIRYRTNFMMLFIILLLFLYQHYKVFYSDSDFNASQRSGPGETD